MNLLIATVAILLQLSDYSSQIIPTRQTAIVAGSQPSVNGSNRLGGCDAMFSTVTTHNTDLLTRFVCNLPSSTVIFDGGLPQLNIGGYRWARGFYTLSAPTVAALNMHLGGVRYSSISRVELIMFNCPWWGIGAESITLYLPLRHNVIGGTKLVTVNPTIASCNSLVKICIPCTRCTNTQRELGLEFRTDQRSIWVHLGEVILRTDNGSCPPDVILSSTTDVVEVCSPIDPDDASCSASVAVASITSIIVTALLATAIALTVFFFCCELCRKKLLLQFDKADSIQMNRAVENQINRAEEGHNYDYRHEQDDFVTVPDNSEHYHSEQVCEDGIRTDDGYEFQYHKTLPKKDKKNKKK